MTETFSAFPKQLFIILFTEIGALGAQPRGAESAREIKGIWGLDTI